jgi:hypothetical protein
MTLKRNEWRSCKRSQNDTMPFGQKSFGRMSCCQHIMVMSVGQNVLTSNININLGAECYLLEGMRVVTLRQGIRPTVFQSNDVVSK